MKQSPRVYLVRAGKHGEDEEYVLENNLAVIGFIEVPSLQKATSRKEFLELIQRASPDRPAGAHSNIAGQLSTFALTMQEGDLMVLPRKTTSQVAIGRVTGRYRYQKVNGEFRHTRPVEWPRPDVPRVAFSQDLLASFRNRMTVCNISRNQASERVCAVLEGKSDPGQSEETGKSQEPDLLEETYPDLSQMAHDQIVERIQSKFKAHDLARLVDAVLQAEGWQTKLSPPGPDGGVDVLAGRGSLGLESPRLCVQVKSQIAPADVTVFRTLQGTMQSFKADQGLLVCWGGFNKVVLKESRQSHFIVRLWDSRDLVEAIYRNYEDLPAEIQAELPMERVWILVADGAAE